MLSRCCATPSTDITRPAVAVIQVKASSAARSADPSVSETPTAESCSDPTISVDVIEHIPYIECQSCAGTESTVANVNRSKRQPRNSRRAGSMEPPAAMLFCGTFHGQTRITVRVC
jgi:hypothetical protein